MCLVTALLHVHADVCVCDLQLSLQACKKAKK